MEVTLAHRRIPVIERSQPSAARFAAQELARAAGFPAGDVYRVGLVATELATNLVKHATGGEILIRRAGAGDISEVEMLAIDRGPGIADPARSLADGHSTAGSAGTGLGAVRRLSDEFDMQSQPGRGTVLLARLRPGRTPAAASGRLAFAGLAVAKPGEEICGDAWYACAHAGGGLGVLVDGLGHGVQAADAASAAIAALDTRAGGVSSMLEGMHLAVRHTRGAAAAIADIRLEERRVTFAGIGNIAAAVSGIAATRRAVSINGTLGHAAREFREFSYPWSNDAIFIMHTDGLSSRWSIDAYPGLRARHPAVVAAVLYRDFARGSDDVAVLVGREGI